MSMIFKLLQILCAISLFFGIAVGAMDAYNHEAEVESQREAAYIYQQQLTKLTELHSHAR